MNLLKGSLENPDQSKKVKITEKNSGNNKNKPKRIKEGLVHPIIAYVFLKFCFFFIAPLY